MDVIFVIFCGLKVKFIVCKYLNWIVLDMLLCWLYVVRRLRYGFWKCGFNYLIN